MDRVIIINTCISTVPALKSGIGFIFIILGKGRKCDATYLIHKNLIPFGKFAEIHHELCKLALNLWEADPYPAMHSITKAQLLVARAFLWTSELWDELRNLTRINIFPPPTPTGTLPWSTIASQYCSCVAAPQKEQCRMQKGIAQKQEDFWRWQCLSMK